MTTADLNVSSDYTYTNMSEALDIAELEKMIPSLELLPKFGTKTFSWALPSENPKFKGTKSICILLEDVKTMQGFKLWTPTASIKDPSASLQTSISMEQYRVIHTMLVERAAKIMALDVDKYFGSKSFYRDFDDLALREKKIIQRYGGGSANLLPHWTSPPIYQDDGTTLKFAPGIKSKANLNKFTGLPQVDIFDASDMENPTYSHAVLVQRSNVLDSDWKVEVDKTIADLSTMPDPYSLVHKYAEYDLATRCLGVQTNGDSWSFSGRLGQVVVTKKSDAVSENSNGVKRPKNAFANMNKYANIAAAKQSALIDVQKRAMGGGPENEPLSKKAKTSE